LHLFKEDFAAENRISKFKYRQYKQTLINQLDSLHDNNPKLYWNLINDLRQQKEKDQRGSVVDPPSWVSHFEKLNQVLPHQPLKSLFLQ
jgi:hypothetical protein